MRGAVIYYSYGGNTRRVAELIANELGWPLACFDTKLPYTGSYEEVFEQGRREMENGYLPELKPFDFDLSEYDTIILGTPVWWFSAAPATQAFLVKTNLGGKALHPFATHFGGLGTAFADIRRLAQGADTHNGFGIKFQDKKQLTTNEEILLWARRCTEE